jgi:hypothetical protein
MNENIKNILVECYNPYTNFDHEKFAKLIVQECANEILKWKSEPFPYDPEFGAKLIKDHFGIE